MRHTVRLITSAALAGLLTACATGKVVESPSFDGVKFVAWSDTAPVYRLIPGDELDIVVYAAPELSRTLIIGPDGRLTLPYAAPVMAAGKTIKQAEADLSQALAKIVQKPDVQITHKTFAAQKVFVGGDVKTPGAYDLPGQIDALQALMLAGGPSDTGKLKEVILIRRSADGKPMMRVLDLKSGLTDARAVQSLVLERFDIVYVPKNGLGKAGVLMDQIRNALPVSFGLYYSLNDTSN